VASPSDKVNIMQSGATYWKTTTHFPLSKKNKRIDFLSLLPFWLQTKRYEKATVYTDIILSFKDIRSVPAVLL